MKLSVVLTAHDEGEMLRTAVASVIRAFDGAGLLLKWRSCHGAKLEIVIVLDCSDLPTAAVASDLHSCAPNGARISDIEVKVITTDFGEPGSARNAGVIAATGDFVAILDGDDLMGRMFLIKSLHNLLQVADGARNANSAVAFHPEFLFYFGEKNLIWRQPSLQEYEAYPRSLLRSNLWDVTVVTTRDLLLRYPYVSATVTEGAGYEDWEWSLMTSQQGVVHEVLPGTVCYKRAKPVSRLTKDNYHSVLIGTARIQPSRL